MKEKKGQSLTKCRNLTTRLSFSCEISTWSLTSHAHRLPKLKSENGANCDVYDRTHGPSASSSRLKLGNCGTILRARRGTPRDAILHRRSKTTSNRMPKRPDQAHAPANTIN